MIKLMFKVVTISVLFYALTFVSFNNEASAEVFSEDYSNEQAVKLYQKILYYLDGNQEIEYAGAYIDDNQVLNIGLVGLDKDRDKEIFIKLAEDMPIKFYDVKYTLKELEDAREDFWGKIEDSWEDYDITSLDINEMENKLVIGIDSKLPPKTFSARKLDLIEKIDLDADDIVFVEEEPIVTQASRNDLNQSVLQGGIYLTSLNPDGKTEKSTLGFGVKDKNGKYGFVMSGHPVKGVGTWVSQGASVGKVTTDGSGKRNSDAIYVQNSAGKVVSSTIYGGYIGCILIMGGQIFP